MQDNNYVGNFQKILLSPKRKALLICQADHVPPRAYTDQYRLATPTTKLVKKSTEQIILWFHNFNKNNFLLWKYSWLIA